MLSKNIRPARAFFRTLSTPDPSNMTPAHLTHIFQPCTQPNRANTANLIALHGVLGSSKNFRGITHSPHIASKVDTYLLDLRNHGKSEHRNSMSYPEMTEDLHHFFLNQNLSGKKNILLGHSMGARLAMEFCTRYPFLVSGVIVVDLAPHNYFEDKRFNFIDVMHSMFERLAHIDLNQDLKVIKQEIMAAAFSQEAGLLVATNLVPDGHGKYTWRINLHSIYQNFKTQILQTEYTGQRRYAGPARVILGGHSEYTSRDLAPSFQKVFSNLDIKKDVITVDNAGHWVHYSQPYKFIELVSEFLDKVLEEKS